MTSNLTIWGAMERIRYVTHDFVDEHVELEDQFEAFMRVKSPVNKNGWADSIFFRGGVKRVEIIRTDNKEVIEIFDDKKSLIKFDATMTKEEMRKLKVNKEYSFFYVDYASEGIVIYILKKGKLVVGVRSHMGRWGLINQKEFWAFKFKKHFLLSVKVKIKDRIEVTDIPHDPKINWTFR